MLLMQCGHAIPVSHPAARSWVALMKKTVYTSSSVKNTPTPILSHPYFKNLPQVSLKVVSNVS